MAGWEDHCPVPPLPVPAARVLSRVRSESSFQQQTNPKFVWTDGRTGPPAAGPTWEKVRWPAMPSPLITATHLTGMVSLSCVRKGEFGPPKFRFVRPVLPQKVRYTATIRLRQSDTHQ